MSSSEIKQLREHHAEIKELLFEEVAILPPGIFRILHSQDTRCKATASELRMSYTKNGNITPRWTV